MIILLMLWNLLVSPYPNNHPTDAQAFRVYNNLVQHTGMNKDYKHRLYIIDRSELNAYATVDDKILLMRGYLNFCRTDSELAYLLAHEIAHVMLEHVQLKSHLTYSSIIHEGNADKMAIYLMMRAGYNPCGAYTFRLHRLFLFGNPPSDSHPSNLNRVMQFYLPECRSN